MEKVKGAIGGAAVTLAVIGGAFGIVLAANAAQGDDPAPTPEPTVTVEAEPTPTATPAVVVTPTPEPVVETPPAEIPVEEPVVEQPAPEVPGAVDEQGLPVIPDDFVPAPGPTDPPPAPEGETGPVSG